MRIIHDALIALGASTAGTLVWLLLGICLIAYFSTHPLRRSARHTPAIFNASYEEVQFPSKDDHVLLSGWYIPSRFANRDSFLGAIILCHGMRENREDGLAWARVLWERGFPLLLFDFRGAGDSETALCSAGYYESRDLRGAVSYLVSRPDCAGREIGVFGFSMGGAVAILAAAEDKRIVAVATHGAYATLDRAILQRCRKHFGPLAPFAAWGTRTLGMRWFPVETSAISPINAVSRLTPRPVLILHGRRDRVVHPADAHDLHDAAGYPKSLHILPRSGHSRIHRSMIQNAQFQVADFFTQHLKPGLENSSDGLERAGNDIPLSGVSPEKNYNPAGHAL